MAGRKATPATPSEFFTEVADAGGVILDKDQVRAFQKYNAAQAVLQMAQSAEVEAARNHSNATDFLIKSQADFNEAARGLKEVIRAIRG